MPRSPGPGPRIPGSRTRPDAVPVEQQRQPGDVVLVRVAQDQRVDAAVPRRDAPVELDEQAVGIGAAVDQQSASPGALDEDRVALPDVEHGHARDAHRSG